MVSSDILDLDDHLSSRSNGRITVPSTQLQRASQTAGLTRLGGSVTPHPFRQRMKALEVACDQREFLMSAPAFELALTRTGREGHLVRG
jgi:hypothetical protein